MPKPSNSSLKRVRIIAFSLLVVLMPFVVYYYLWVTRQTKYYTGRDIRVLATLTRHVEESVSGQSRAFTNAIEKYLNDLQQPATENDPKNASDAMTSPGYQKLQHDTQQSLKEFQANSLDPLKADGTNLTIASVDFVSKPADESSPKLRMEIREEDPRSLYFSYTTTYPPGNASQGEEKNITRAYLNFKARTNLADLVGQFADTDRIADNEDSYQDEPFDAVVVAELNDSMGVVFEEGSAKMRLVSLNNLVAPDGSKLDLKQLGQSTNVADVKLGAAEYKLFYRPLQLPLERLSSNDRKPIKWLVCGFVENGRFRSEAWAVSYLVLIIFGFLTALIALSWPFLKLVLIGPKDRLRPIDTYLLLISGVMIAALLTLFGCFTLSYRGTAKALDDDLASLSKSLADHFDGELKDALSQIDDLNCDPKLLQSGKAVKTLKFYESTEHRQSTRIFEPSSEFRLPGNCNSQDQTASVTSNDPSGDRRLILLEDKPKHYAYFISAYWVDWNGDQQIKWSTRQNVTNNVSVADREYFYKVRNGSFYEYDKHQFYLQPIVSKTTGRSEAVISKAVFPFQPDSEFNQIKVEETGVEKDLMWISAMNTRLLSVMDPIVPSGFGFAVIDQTGTVLFHSDEKRHLGENFFEESDNNEKLRMAVRDGSQQLIEAPYLGKDHAMFVRPMGELMGKYGWTVIAFRNKDYLRTTFSEILTLCLALFFIYLVWLLIVLLLMYLLNRKSKDPVSWLWPTPHKRGIYAASMLVKALLLLVSASTVYWHLGLATVFVPVACAFAGVAHCIWILKRGTEAYLPVKVVRDLPKPKFLTYQVFYTLNATLLFAIISIVPAYASFKVAHAEEIKLFIKAGQLDFAQDMVGRETRLRAQYLDNLPIHKRKAMEKFVTDRIYETKTDVYDSVFFGTKVENSNVNAHATGFSQGDTNLIALFKTVVPFLHPRSFHRNAFMSAAGSPLEGWEELADRLILHIRAQATRPQQIVSSLPRMNGSWSTWLAALIILGFLTYTFRKIFLLNKRESRLDLLNGFRATSVSQNLFIVLNRPFIGRRELFKRLGFDDTSLERIDMQQSADVEKWVKHSSRLTHRPTSTPARPLPPVILDNFDYGIENPACDQRRLLVLEKLFDMERVAIALSNYEPDRFTNGKPEGHSANGTSPLITDRWTRAVSRFLRVTIEDLGDLKAFETRLERRKNELLSDANLATAQQIEAVFETIERECSASACLQNIGEGIAKQTDLVTRTPEQISKQVLLQATPYYKSIWDLCSDYEKLSLSHLAQDGLLSPNDPDIDRLMEKGLIVSGPPVKLMNESFRSFVLIIEDEDDLARCKEKARKMSNWEALKVPLSIGVASVIVFLFLTQRELYNSTLPVITAITAGVPTFFSLISVLHGGGGPGKPTQSI